MAEDEALTEAELSEMERRTEAAAPGPWVAFLETRGGVGDCSVIQVGRGNDIDDEIYVRRFIGTKELVSPNPQLDSDIEFIAAARQDMPRLIAEVKRLRTLVDAPAAG
jgi:hypothetical protein